MKNLIQPGNNLTLTAPAGGVVSGNAYLIGGLLVVAIISADAGEQFTAYSEGVCELPKEDSAAAFDEGDVAYWDDTAKEFDESAVGRYGAATVIAAAVAADKTVKVKLFGHAVPAVV
jgi:predicted RecA/RadA family phage recombinase